MLLDGHLGQLIDDEPGHPKYADEEDVTDDEGADRFHRNPAAVVLDVVHGTFTSDTPALSGKDRPAAGVSASRQPPGLSRRR